MIATRSPLASSSPVRMSQPIMPRLTAAEQTMRGSLAASSLTTAGVTSSVPAA